MCMPFLRSYCAIHGAICNNIAVLQTFLHMQYYCTLQKKVQYILHIAKNHIGHDSDLYTFSILDLCSICFSYFVDFHIFTLRYEAIIMIRKEQTQQEKNCYEYY